MLPWGQRDHTATHDHHHAPGVSAVHTVTHLNKLPLLSASIRSRSSPCIRLATSPKSSTIALSFDEELTASGELTSSSVISVEGVSGAEESGAEELSETGRSEEERGRSEERGRAGRFLEGFPVERPPGGMSVEKLLIARASVSEAVQGLTCQTVVRCISQIPSECLRRDLLIRLHRRR